MQQSPGLGRSCSPHWGQMKWICQVSADICRATGNQQAGQVIVDSNLTGMCCLDFPAILASCD